MKRLLFLALLGAQSLSAPSLAAGLNCKSIYDGAYKVMMLRQSGVPVHVLLDAFEKEADKDRKTKRPEEYELDHHFAYEALEAAYDMPHIGFFHDAAHQLAVEFANQQYIKCMRINRQ